MSEDFIEEHQLVTSQSEVTSYYLQSGQSAYDFFFKLLSTSIVFHTSRKWKSKPIDSGRIENNKVTRSWEKKRSTTRVWFNTNN